MFEVGQKVLCISTTEDKSIEIGCVYTISHIDEADPPNYNSDDIQTHANCPPLGVELVEKPRNDECYCVCHFRPIDDPALELFREMTRTKEKQGV